MTLRRDTLEKLKELLAASTPGVWRVVDDIDGVEEGWTSISAPEWNSLSQFVVRMDGEEKDHLEGRANLDLTVLLHNVAGSLIKAAEEKIHLTEIIDALREQLAVDMRNTAEADAACKERDALRAECAALKCETEYWKANVSDLSERPVDHSRTVADLLNLADRVRALENQAYWERVGRI